MKQARQAPVFKPLSNTENTSLFNFESQAPNVRPSASVPFVRSNENHLTNVQTKLTQSQDVGTERLSSLHAKLHQEADKIRKWKVQTEIELKQKEKKIQEASLTNESLRKSILDLQLQNENLSLKLQEEIGNREDVVQRITSTRQLCNVLKDHAVKLEERLHHCETERTELKYLEKDHLQQFEELSAAFKKLEISSIENQNRLENQLEVERDDRRKLEEQLEAKLTEAEIQLKELMDQCDDKDIEIRDVRTMLQRNDDKIHSLEKTIASLQEKSERQIADIQLKECDLETTSEKLLCTEKEKQQYEEKLSEITEKLEGLQMAKHSVEQSMVSSRAEYDTKLASLEQHCEELKSSLLSETQKTKALEEQLAEAVQLTENLKSSKDMLTLENTKFDGTIAVLNKDLIECRRRIEEQTEAHAILTENYRQINLQLEENKAQNDQLQIQTETGHKTIQQRDDEIKRLNEIIQDCERIINEKEGIIQSSFSREEALKQQLTSTLENNHELQNALKTERENVEQMVPKFEKLKAEIEEKTQEITYRDCDVNKLKKENEKIQKDQQMTRKENEGLQKKFNSLEVENETLTHKNEELQTMLDELREEQREHDRSLDTEMKSKSKQMSDLESKHKELRTDMMAKNKQIRELEKEMRGIKSKLTSQVKATEAKTKELTELEEELQMMKLSNDNIQSNLKSLDEDLKGAKSSENNAIKQMKDMKNQLDKSLKEKKETEDKCEFQLSEMMATMDKYKKENSKIVQQKEKEIELLKSKSDDISVQKQQLLEMKKHSDDMKASLDQALLEKTDLQQKLSNQGVTFEGLEKAVMLKDTEITELQERIKSLVKEAKKKKTSTSQTQTSPKAYSIPEQVSTPLKPDAKALEKQTTQTPQNSFKTPQRSILRNVSSVSKRRKVAFSSHDDSGRHSGSDSDSSTELMELEIDNVESKYNSKVKSTPLLIRPSPKVKPSPKPEKSDLKTDSLPKTPLIRIPRGPPVNLHEKKQKSKKESVINDEKEMFKQLFPAKTDDLISEKENKYKKMNQDVTHLRKTPSKNTGKFFKASPKERFSKKARQSGKEDIAWFDTDNVFGFED